MDPSKVLFDVSQLIHLLILVAEGALLHRAHWNILLPCLKLIRPLLEELKNCWTISDLSPLFLLENSLLRAKDLAEESNSKVYKVVCCEQVANWFQEVVRMLDEALSEIPLDSLEISAQVHSQALLGMEQLRKLSFLPDISEQMLHNEIEGLLAEMRDQQHVRPEKLVKLFDKLQITSDELLVKELDALEAVKEQARLAKHKTEEEYFERIISLLMQMVKCSPEGVQVRSEIRSLSVPSDFRCPLSLEIMADPVIIASGQTYERAYIQQWIHQGNTTCPKTRQALAHTNLIPNYTVKALITNWCEANQAPVPAPVRLGSSVAHRKLCRKVEKDEDSQGINVGPIEVQDKHEEQPADEEHQVDNKQDGRYAVDGEENTHRQAVQHAGDGQQSIQAGTVADPYGSPRSVRTVRSHSFANGDSARMQALRSNEDWSFVSDKSGTLQRLSKLRASPSGSSSSSDGPSEIPQTPVSIDASIDLSDYSPYNSDISGDMGAPYLRRADTGGRKPDARNVRVNSGPTVRKAAVQRSARSITDGALRVLIENSVEDLQSDNTELQLAAAEELRLLAKYDPENRILIAGAGAIPPLIRLVSSPEKRIQENAVTALLNLSIDDGNKLDIAAAGAIGPLVEVLKHGTPTARENSAAALFMLSVLDENKAAIGASGAVKPLVDLLVNGSLRGQKDAATALFNLSLYTENKVRIVNAGAVKAFVDLVKDPTSGMVDKAVAVLANLMTVPEGRVAIGEDGGIPALVEVIEAGTPRGKENAAAALLHLCTNSVRHKSMVLQEGAIPPLHSLSQTGTPRAKEKASALLRHFREQRHVSFGSRSSHQF